MKRKLWSTLLVLCMVLSLLPFGAAAAEEIVASGTCDDGLTWSLDDEGVLWIDGDGAMCDFAELTDRPWHSHCDAITCVEIGTGVTRIGSNAFSGCGNLERVFTPHTLESIGAGVFAGCDALREHITDLSLKNWAALKIEEEGNDPLFKIGLIVPPGSGPAGIYNFFDDVRTTDYFAEAVLWAVRHDPPVTTGIADRAFAPVKACTRAQLVTFLWRAAGEPKPEIAKNPFTDVKESAYYYDAVLWAVEQGITTGTGPDTFTPNDVVTRAQTVTFLWRMTEKARASTLSYGADTVVYVTDYGSKYHLDGCRHQSKSLYETTLYKAAAAGYGPCDVCISSVENGIITPVPAKSSADGYFKDIPSGQYYSDAVLWAVENHITTGTGATTFSPNNPCTRAQIVTFLYRALG